MMHNSISAVIALSHCVILEVVVGRMDVEPEVYHYEGCGKIFGKSLIVVHMPVH